MFIGLVRAVHAEEAFVDAHGDVDFPKALGIAYAADTVRERPTYNLRVDDLRRTVQSEQ